MRLNIITLWKILSKIREVRCEKQVTNYKGAVFKKFKTRQEAEEFLKYVKSSEGEDEKKEEKLEREKPKEVQERKCIGEDVGEEEVTTATEKSEKDVINWEEKKEKEKVCNVEQSMKMAWEWLLKNVKIVKRKLVQVQKQYSVMFGGVATCTQMMRHRVGKNI